MWNLAGRPSGNYSAATKGDLVLPKLAQHGGLDLKRLSDHTRAQLLAVSGATIDRTLKPIRDGAQLVGVSVPMPGPLLRNSIQVRKAGDGHEKAPGFVEVGLVLHCGASLQGELAGRGRAHLDGHRRVHRVDGEHGAEEWCPPVGDRGDDGNRGRLPFPLVGLDTDNGGELAATR
ncbi:MAG: hypothetical protein LH624_13075 [Cryobacterium sp.]|nr:hypothetical protein [Cryobacterium sp.]